MWTDCAAVSRVVIVAACQIQPIKPNPLHGPWCMFHFSGCVDRCWTLVRYTSILQDHRSLQPLAIALADPSSG